GDGQAAGRDGDDGEGQPGKGGQGGRAGTSGTPGEHPGGNQDDQRGEQPPPEPEVQRASLLWLCRDGHQHQPGAEHGQRGDLTAPQADTDDGRDDCGDHDARGDGGLAEEQGQRAQGYQRGQEGGQIKGDTGHVGDRPG